MGNRTVRTVTAAAIAVLAAGVVLAVLRDDGAPTITAAGGDGGAGAAGAWVRLPDPPLRPRTDASVAWTGREVIVVGGWDFLCPPGADCAPSVPPTRFDDGAAYDPATRTWRSIADAPTPLLRADTAVVDGDLFVLVDCSPDANAAGALPGRCPGLEPGAVLLRYDPGGDRWATLPGPPSTRSRDLTAVGSSLVVHATTDERGESPDLRFDVAEGTWSELPEDPLPAAFDRSVVPWADGGELLLFGAPLGTEPPDERPVLGARLDLSSLEWTALPPAPSRGFRAWGVDDRVVLEPHFGGSGGILDPATGTWSATPAAPGSFDPNGVAGAIGDHGAVYGGANGWVLDVSAHGWLEVPPVDDRTHQSEPGVVAVGRDLFVYGGERWTTQDGELLGDAWLWRAPAPTSADGPPAT